MEIRARAILVAWRSGPRTYRYQGVRTGQGYFLLRSDDGSGYATLHRFPRSLVLEGYWERRAMNGFWRVHLPASRREDTLPSGLVAGAVPPPPAPRVRARRRARG